MTKVIAVSFFSVFVYCPCHNLIMHNIFRELRAKEMEEIAAEIREMKQIAALEKDEQLRDMQARILELEFKNTRTMTTEILVLNNIIKSLFKLKLNRMKGENEMEYEQDEEYEYEEEDAEEDEDEDEEDEDEQEDAEDEDEDEDEDEGEDEDEEEDEDEDEDKDEEQDEDEDEDEDKDEDEDEDEDEEEDEDEDEDEEKEEVEVDERANVVDMNVNYFCKFNGIICILFYVILIEILILVIIFHGYLVYDFISSNNIDI